MSKRMWIWAAAGLLGGIASTYAQTWSLRNDFSQSGADNPPWAYGHGHGEGSAGFTLGGIDANFGGWGWLFMYNGNHWYGDGWPLPGVGTNKSAIPHDPFGAATINPGDIVLVSGEEPQYKAAVRWTAPATAVYSVNAVFQGARSSLYNADVYVYQNDTRLSPDPTDPGPTYLRSNQSYTYTNSSLALNAADQLFFMAGTGANWSQIHDWTKLDVTITQAELVDVQGTVSMPGYVGSLDAVKVNVIMKQGTEVVKSEWFDLSTAGQFTVTEVPVGTYDVVVKAYASLATSRTVTISATSTDLGTFELAGGNANGDDQVSFEDFAILQNAYGQHGAEVTNPLANLAATGGCGSLGLLLIAALGLTGWKLGLRDEA